MFLWEVFILQKSEERCVRVRASDGGGGGAMVTEQLGAQTLETSVVTHVQARQAGQVSPQGHEPLIMTDRRTERQAGQVSPQYHSAVWYVTKNTPVGFLC